jgi:outer membrane protein assembly factor BamB
MARHCGGWVLAALLGCLAGVATDFSSPACGDELSTDSTGLTADSERTAVRPAQLPADGLSGLGARGLCVLLGDKQCLRACDLAGRTQWTFYVPLENADDAAAAARAAHRAGLLGTRIFVDKIAAGKIGLADNLADAVVAVQPGQTSREEILRVLTPRGVAIVGQEKFHKPVPEGVDDWSHHYHGANNNTQSLDTVARFPYLTQFIAEPRYAPGPQCTVSSAGRVFMAFGHVAWHEREEPMLNTLVAVNGYNGTMLWKRPLTPGIMVDRSTMIATPETLYLADEKSCKLLDPATGAVRGEIAPPAELTGGTFWKWMALEGGVLYALIGEEERQDPDAKWRSRGHGWPWDGISKGYNAPEYPWGFSKTLLAIDPATKKVLWSHKEDALIDSRSLCLSAGRIYFAHFGRYLACLDAKSGQSVWRRTPEKDPEVFQGIGPYRPGHGYVGGWKSTVYIKCTDKALYVVGPQVEWLSALSADDGRFLWKHPSKDLQIVIRDDGVYTIGPQGSSDSTKKLDLMSGRVLAEYKTSRRACTRSVGTCDAIFFRAAEGTGRFDLAGGQTQWISAMRPSCHIGVVVANGLLYWVPWTCDCNLQMFGTIALGPAGAFDFQAEATEAKRLERGAEAAVSLVTAANDWPTFQANSARTARTEAAVPETIRLLWKMEGKEAGLRTGGTPVPLAKAPVPPVKAPAPQSDPRGPLLTAPVLAGGLAFVGALDGTVRAVDAATGETKWTAFTGGEVRYPPTIAEGLAFVGSGDGWVYAFDAATGRTAWRFRAAPSEEKIAVYGAILSRWPVAGGVLVDRGIAYFAAGLMDLDGTHVYALEAKTGKIVWQNNTSGHLDEWSRRGVACQGQMLLHEGKLYLAGGNSVSPAVFDAATGKCQNGPPTGPGSQAPRGRELHLVANDVKVTGQPLYSIPQFPVFDGSVAWSDVKIATKNAEIGVRSQPNGAALLVARDASGKQLWREPLPAEPVRWGVAVDGQGRIVVTLASGQVLCFGPQRAAAE